MKKVVGITIIILGLIGIITSLLLPLAYVTLCILVLIVMLGVWIILPLQFDFISKHSHSKEHGEKTDS